MSTTPRAGETLCPFCLMAATLPETLPFGEHAQCAVCKTVLLEYLPCPTCERSFDPRLPACPTCGVRPPVEALHSPIWRISDRAVREALASLQPPAPVAQEPAARPAAPPAASKRPANGNGHSNGKSNGNEKRATPLADLPVVVPRFSGPQGNGQDGATAMPPSQDTAEPAPDEAAGMLFGSGDSPDVSGSAAALDAEYELVQDHARLAEVVAELSGATVVAVDTETTGLDPFAENALLLVQIATPERAYLIDARRADPRPLRRILEDERTLKLLQNAKFDYKMLRQQTGMTMRNMYDTMLAERVLTAGISRDISLAKLAQKYAGITLDKSIRSSFIGKTGEFSADQLRYAARDAQVLFTIYAQQRDALKRERQLDVAKLEFQTLAAVGNMELAGCLIDQERWRKIIDAAKDERDRAALELGELLAGAIPQMSLFGGPAINLNSNAQLIETFKRMGIDLPDTMEATLTKPEYDHPAIKKLIEYRGFEKTLSAFGEKFLELIHSRTGRIHPDFNQLGADTGRFSCTNPNVQQIPATSDFRSCFVAPPGYKLITADYSQCIARDTWISTATGWTRIQDHPQACGKGVAETVLVRTKRQYQLECTPDHRLLTDHGWVAASDLKQGDWVALEGQRAAALAAPDPYWWLIGFWVGDGSFNNAPGSVYFAKNTEPDTSELRKFIEATLGECPRAWGESFGVTNQRPFADTLRSLFNKKDLRLPLDRIGDVASFLSGLFDADGYSDRFGVGFASKFEGLAFDVQHALLRFGIMSTVIKCHGGYNFIPDGANYYRVYLSDNVSARNFARHIGFRFTRKAAALQALVQRERRDQGNFVPLPVEHVRTLGLDYRTHVLNHLHGRPYTRRKVQDIPDPLVAERLLTHWDRIAAVEPSGRAVEVFDVMDQPEQRFIANGFVVHNCELRILAQLSEDPAFVAAFTSGGDLHQLTASQMFQVPADQVSKPQRSAAKVINFGLAYGRGPAALGVQLGVSTEEAKKLIDQYFKAYSGIGRWLDRAAREAVRKGYSVTMLGRKRYYPPLDSGDPDYNKKRASIERQGKNSPIQGCLPGHVRIFEEAHGYVPIESLCGEQVSVWDGHQFVRAAVVASGKKQLVKVSLWGGHSIECSPEHRFLVRDPNGRYMWKTPGEFKPQHRVMLAEGVPAWAGDLRMPPNVCDGSWNGKQVSLSQIDDPGDRTVVQVLKKDMPLFAERIGFMNSVKQAKACSVSGILREQTYGRGVRVRQVEVTDQWVEMYDVVNSETGRFMANGLIVHNSNADMTKLALVGLNEVLQDYDARVVNTVHDEIVVEAREDQAEVVCTIVEREMVKAGERIIKLVPIVADAKIADYWSK